MKKVDSLKVASLVIIGLSLLLDLVSNGIYDKQTEQLIDERIDSKLEKEGSKE